MRMHEWLIQLAPEMLEEIAAAWMGMLDKLGIDGHKLDQVRNEEELMRTLAGSYTPDRVAKAVRQTTAAEQATLEMIAVLADDSNGMLIVDALQKARSLFGDAALGREAIRALEAKGLLFRLRAYWKERLVLPDEIREIVLDETASRLADRIQTADDLAVTGKGSIGRAVYHDLLTVMAMAAKEAAEVTQKGHIYRRTMNKIVPRLRSPERLYPEPFAGDMPKHFYFLESFLKREGYAEFDQSVRLDKSRVQQLLSMPYAEWARHLHRFYETRVYAGSRMPVQLLKRLFQRFAQTGVWTDQDDLWQAVSSESERWGILLRADQLDMVLYHPLELLGLIEWGTDAGGRNYWRWTSLGREYALGKSDSNEANADIYVQPNLEIIMPEIVPPAVRWGIEAMAEPGQLDTTSTYRITRESIRHALESGWDTEFMVQFLKQYSKVPVADNVRQTIEGWTGRFGAAELWDVLLIRVRDADVAEDLRNRPQFRRWVAAELADDAFVIRRQEEANVRDWMRGIGYEMPRKVRDPGGVDQAGTSGAGGEELVAASNKRTHIRNLDAFHPDLVRRALAAHRKFPFANQSDSL